MYFFIYKNVIFFLYKIKSVIDFERNWNVNLNDQWGTSIKRAFILSKQK